MFVFTTSFFSEWRNFVKIFKMVYFNVVGDLPTEKYYRIVSNKLDVILVRLNINCARPSVKMNADWRTAFIFTYSSRSFIQTPAISTEMQVIAPLKGWGEKILFFKNKLKNFDRFQSSPAGNIFILDFYFSNNKCYLVTWLWLIE